MLCAGLDFELGNGQEDRRKCAVESFFFFCTLLVTAGERNECAESAEASRRVETVARTCRGHADEHTVTVGRDLDCFDGVEESGSLESLCVTAGGAWPLLLWARRREERNSHTRRPLWQTTELLLDDASQGRIPWRA